MSRFLCAATAALVVAAALVSAAASFAAVPNRLHIIDTSSMSEDQLVMVQSLQGIVARKAQDGQPQIWISGEINPDLLTFVTKQFHISMAPESDPFQLLARFQSQVVGFEQCNLGLRSMNVAAPLAGVDSAVVASTSGIINALSDPSVNLGLKTDVTQNDESFWFGKFSQLNPSLLIELGLESTGRDHLRDLSASDKVLTYTDGLFGLVTFRAKAMPLTTPHSNVLGFPQDANDIEWVRAASVFKHPAVRAETAHDLSVLSGIGTGLVHSQPAGSHTGAVTTQDGVHYVCIVLDGGWDIGFTLNQFQKANWFGNTRRGRFPMNWEISPALLDFAPAALDYFYSKSNDSDFFVSAPSGYGMLYPSKYPDLAGYAELLGPKLKDSDLRVVNVMADTGGALKDAEPILDRPEVLGVFYKTNFSFFTGIPAAQFDVHNGKVIWPYRYALWNNGIADNTAAGIASAIMNDPHTSPRTEPLSYSLVAVSPTAFWDNNPDGSSIMDTVSTLVDQLNTDPTVRIVSAEEFVWLLRQNFGDGQGGPRFGDVPTTFWAWEDIEAVAKANIAQGFPGGTFQPSMTVDRAQMAVFIARAVAKGDGNVPSGPAVPSFSDVPKPHFAYKYVEFCKNKNVVQGFPDGRYHPDDAVNRGQMAVFIARAGGACGRCGDSSPAGSAPVPGCHLHE